MVNNFFVKMSTFLSRGKINVPIVIGSIYVDRDSSADVKMLANPENCHHLASPSPFTRSTVGLPLCGGGSWLGEDDNNRKGKRR